MKKLIIVLGLLMSHAAFAQEVSESAWKSQARVLLTKVMGSEWSDKLLGVDPSQVLPTFEMPVIPEELKKSTDVESYTKQTKDPTEFDRLPTERKRQFNYKFLEELFIVTRKTPAKDEDLSNWLNTLDQGGSREGIYQALVLDEIYSGLESIEEQPTKKLLSFCLKFSETFLNQTFSPESLQKLNLYSLKRIFTEKALDLLEHYETKDLDALYRWYALFSAELATNYAPMLLSEIRKDPSAKFHYEWAKGMPVQHIKSEVIIKMHIVMNALQLLNQE